MLGMRSSSRCAAAGVCVTVEQPLPIRQHASLPRTCHASSWPVPSRSDRRAAGIACNAATLTAPPREAAPTAVEQARPHSLGAARYSDALCYPLRSVSGALGSHKVSVQHAVHYITATCAWIHLKSDACLLTTNMLDHRRRGQSSSAAVSPACSRLLPLHPTLMRYWCSARLPVMT